MPEWVSILVSIGVPILASVFGWAYVNLNGRIDDLGTEVISLKEKNGKLETKLDNLVKNVDSHDKYSERLTSLETAFPYIVKSTEEIRNIIQDLQKSMQRMEVAFERQRRDV